MNRTPNMQIMETYWEALAARDWEAMKPMIAADAEYTDVGVPGEPGIGPDGFIARLQPALDMLESYVHLPGTRMLGDEDLVMTEHTERWGFGNDHFVDHSYVSVTELSDGLITRWHDYSNLANIFDNAPPEWIEKMMALYADRSAK